MAETAALTPPGTDARQWGRSRRRELPRTAQADPGPSVGRADPVALLEASNRGRRPEWIPIRFGRMAASPFTFFRGAADLMARDLATTPVTGIHVQLCGDAHLSNFGLYATSERRLVFGVNDFDETMPGPWEWDVKRLATSMVVAARSLSLPARRAEGVALATVASYRRHLRMYASMRHVDVWYSTVDVSTMLTLMRSSRARRTARKARERDHLRALGRLSEYVGGAPRIRNDPPLVIRVETGSEALAPLDDLMAQYRDAMPVERRVLFDRYRLMDVALKVVGVGSVGTHCWIGLFVGNGRKDPLFLQVKEARPSVLETGLGPSSFDQQGQRVVTGQRLMQAFPDIFLGWATASESGRHYYVRQLHDMKGSLDTATMPAEELVAYGQLCAWTLARSHARSGNAAAISGYLGSAPAFDAAVAAYARHYADRNEADFAAFVAAIGSGRLPAAFGV
jgi:uncharacterized protein (DUF2252 family)